MMFDEAYAKRCFLSLYLFKCDHARLGHCGVKALSPTSESYSRNCSSICGPFSDIPGTDACNCEEACKPVHILISTSA